MPTPLLIVPSVRSGLRQIDEKARFVEDAEQMMGKRWQQQSHMRAWRNMRDEIREVTKDLVVSKIAGEHAGSEGSR